MDCFERDDGIAFQCDGVWMIRAESEDCNLTDV